MPTPLCQQRIHLHSSCDCRGFMFLLWQDRCVEWPIISFLADAGFKTSRNCWFSQALENNCDWFHCTSYIKPQRTSLAQIFSRPIPCCKTSATHLTVCSDIKELWWSRTCFNFAEFAHSLSRAQLFVGLIPPPIETGCDPSILRSCVEHPAIFHAYVNIFLLILIIPSEIDSEIAIQLKTSNLEKSLTNWQIAPDGKPKMYMYLGIKSTGHNENYKIKLGQ